VGGEIDSAGQEMRARPQPGQGRGAHRVPCSPEEWDDLTPTPPTMPGAVHQDEGCDVVSSIFPLDYRVVALAGLSGFSHEA
jgi:hypothetical protein